MRANSGVQSARSGLQMKRSSVRAPADRIVRRLSVQGDEMGSSFVEYRGHGFWSYDAYLEHLLALLAEAVGTSPAEDWLAHARDHWLKMSSGIFSGWIHPNLDEYLTSDEHCQIFLKVLGTIQSREDITREVKETSELLRKLLAGNLETDESSPLDYMVTGIHPYQWRIR